MEDVINFVNKMKKVFDTIPDEEIDTYNNIYNNGSTEAFVYYIYRRYRELFF